MDLIVKFLPAFGVLALLFVFIKNAWVGKQDEGEEKMSRIAKKYCRWGNVLFKGWIQDSCSFRRMCRCIALFQRGEWRRVQWNGSRILYSGCYLFRLGRIHRYEGRHKGQCAYHECRQKPHWGKALEVAFAGGCRNGTWRCWSWCFGIEWPLYGL